MRNDGGELAAVQFRFDGWNEQFTPYDKDAAVPARTAEAWGARLCRRRSRSRRAFNTDGEDTLRTTEQCLLHNRNLGLGRVDNEALLRDWLGVETVIWLPYGLVEDSGPLSTSGHVDDVAQFVRRASSSPTCEPDNPNYSRLQENLETWRRRRTPPVAASSRGIADAAVRQRRGCRADGVTGPGVGKLMSAPYVNMVFVEGAVLLPLNGEEGEDVLHREIGELVGREPVGLPTERSASAAAGWAASRSRCPPGRRAATLSRYHPSSRRQQRPGHSALPVRAAARRD